MPSWPSKRVWSLRANRELRLHLAQTYFSNGMLEEALSEFEALVEADPQNLKYRQELAKAALWSADAARASRSMLGYALALQKEGSYDKAKAVLEDCASPWISTVPGPPRPGRSAHAAEHAVAGDVPPDHAGRHCHAGRTTRRLPRVPSSACTS